MPSTMRASRIGFTGRRRRVSIVMLVKQAARLAQKRQHHRRRLMAGSRRAQGKGRGAADLLRRLDQHQGLESRGGADHRCPTRAEQMIRDVRGAGHHQHGGTLCVVLSACQGITAATKRGESRSRYAVTTSHRLMAKRIGVRKLKSVVGIHHHQQSTGQAVRETLGYSTLRMVRL